MEAFDNLMMKEMTVRAVVLIVWFFFLTNLLHDLFKDLANGFGWSRVHRFGLLQCTEHQSLNFWVIFCHWQQQKRNRSQEMKETKYRKQLDLWFACCICIEKNTQQCCVSLEV